MVSVPATQTCSCNMKAATEKRSKNEHAALFQQNFTYLMLLLISYNLHISRSILSSDFGGGNHLKVKKLFLVHEHIKIQG